MSYFRAKYIVLEDWTPVVFGETLSHKHVAKLGHGTCLGAGFCSIDADGRYHCYGNSESLQIDSRGKEDSDILNKVLGVDKE